jgi:hypothetical protein
VTTSEEEELAKQAARARLRISLPRYGAAVAVLAAALSVYAALGLSGTVNVSQPREVLAVMAAVTGWGFVGLLWWLQLQLRRQGDNRQEGAKGPA